MPEKCGKCEVVLSASEVIAKCLVCKNGFHPACTRAGSAQNFSKSKSKTWKCDECSGETGSVKSNEGGEDKDSILDAIRQMKCDINKNIEEKVSEVLTSVNDLKEDIKGVRESIASLEAAHSKVEERCSLLEQDNAELRDKVQSLQLQLLDSEQHQRAANIVIDGLPVTENEDIYSCLEHVARAVGVNYKRGDVSIAHRLRLYSKRIHSHPPIIVQFVSRSVRATWLAAARRKKNLNSRDVAPSLPPSNVFVNEHLTTHNKVLLGKARRLQREKKIYFAGYFNGKVMIKTSEKEESIRITSLEDLDKYDSQ